MEGRGAEEEVLVLVVAVGELPAGQVRLEVIGELEHAHPVCRGGGVPLGQVRLERLCAVEHEARVLDVAHVPVGQVLVEQVAVLDHVPHVGDVRDIPLGDILVELAIKPAALVAVEHEAHVGDLADVPPVHDAVIAGEVGLLALLDGVGNVGLGLKAGALPGAGSLGIGDGLLGSLLLSLVGVEVGSTGGAALLAAVGVGAVVGAARVVCGLELVTEVVLVSGHVIADGAGGVALAANLEVAGGPGAFGVARVLGDAALDHDARLEAGELLAGALLDVVVAALVLGGADGLAVAESRLLGRSGFGLSLGLGSLLSLEVIDVRDTVDAALLARVVVGAKSRGALVRRRLELVAEVILSSWHITAAGEGAVFVCHTVDSTFVGGLGALGVALICSNAALDHGTGLEAGQTLVGALRDVDVAALVLGGAHGLAVTESLNGGSLGLSLSLLLGSLLSLERFVVGDTVEAALLARVVVGAPLRGALVRGGLELIAEGILVRGDIAAAGEVAMVVGDAVDGAVALDVGALGVALILGDSAPDHGTGLEAGQTLVGTLNDVDVAALLFRGAHGLALAEYLQI